MKKRRLDLLLVSLTGLTVLSVLGSSIGTLAWYAYATRATVSYQGTAVRKTELLQIGLEWDADTYPVDEETATKFKTDYLGEGYFETTGGYTYAFMAPGAGFSSAAINQYLVLHGMATNKLPPLTTWGDFTTGDSGFSLYESPTYSHAYVRTPASARSWVKLPFAFHIYNGEDTQITNRVKDMDIWVTDAHAEAAGSSNVEEAIRVHFDRLDTDHPHETTGVYPSAQKFLLNPSRKDVNTHTTYVGGVLDLDDDGFYDYDVRTNKEIYYGLQTDAARLTPVDFTAETAGIDDPDDINGTGDTRLTTFRAKHQKGVSGFTGYKDKTDATVDVRKKVVEDGFKNIQPTMNVETGEWQGGKPAAHISNNDAAIGRCDIDIYLEGWDHAIVDQILSVEGGARFNLGLQFEINQVK